MSVTIKEVQGRQDLRTFIFLPAKIHAGNPQWLPPFYMDERAYYNPEKNPAFAYCDTILYLAYEGSKPVGRVMGIINHPYNRDHNEKTVRFEHIEAYDNESVVHALLDAVEQWGRSKGMNKIVGPFGFSDKDPEGLLVEGFDKMPVMVSACNLPYLPRYVESHGYSKKTDCLDYLIDLESGLPETYQRIYERILKNTPYKLGEYTKTKEIKPFIVPVFELINKTYKDIYGFTPMDRKEMQEMADRYLPVLDPRFLKLAFDPQGNLVAFILGLPNMTPGIQRSKGHLFPFGFIPILYAAKTTKQLDLMLGAVDEEVRGRGLDILVGWSLILSAKKAGMKTMETHLVLETNTAMRAEYERVGAKLHKLFRIFQKNLD